MTIFQSILLILLSFNLVGTTNYTQNSRGKEYIFRSKLEKEVLAELNLVRQHPKRYARILEKERTYYVGKYIQRPGKIKIITKEGVSALDEAVRFLKSAKKLPRLKFSHGMSSGARDHVQNQGNEGSLGHTGSDGSQPWDRITRYGTWERTVGENIAYGTRTAREIVTGLIIDDGVPDRGHRKNIFNKDFKVAGIAIGYHKIYKTMCVITFAGGFEER